MKLAWPSGNGSTPGFQRGCRRYEQGSSSKLVLRRKFLRLELSKDNRRVWLEELRRTKLDHWGAAGVVEEILKRRSCEEPLGRACQRRAAGGQGCRRQTSRRGILPFSPRGREMRIDVEVWLGLWAARLSGTGSLDLATVNVVSKKALASEEELMVVSSFVLA